MSVHDLTQRAVSTLSDDDVDDRRESEVTSDDEARSGAGHGTHAAHEGPGGGWFARGFAAVDRHPGWTLTVAVVLSAVVYLVNLTRSPDFNIDETFYALAGRNIGLYDAVSFGVEPVRVHPPIFFIAVGGWLGLFGDLRAPVLDAIHVARYMNAILDVAVVVLTVLLGRAWTRERGPVVAGRVVVGAVVLVTLNAFLLRFGRLLLIEPMAVASSLLALYVGWRLRDRPAALFVPVVGAFVGIALLVKEPTLFLVASPVIGAALQRDGRGFRRQLGALLLGGVVWLTFPIWEALNGDWAQFFFTQTFSIRRLVGLVQVSGLNRPGASPAAAFTDTFWQYSGAYITFGLGGVSLALGLWRWFTTGRGRGLSEGAAQLLGLGVLSYGFLLYSVTVGQSNEQLTVYSVPAAVLMTLAWPLLPRRAAHRRTRGRSTVDQVGETRTAPAARRRLPVVVSVALVLSAALGAVGWGRYFVFENDDATARVETFLQQNYADCVPVNATGDPFHWYATLRTQPITAFASGPEALSEGVHVFLVSPKDAKFAYGSSSVELNDWIEANGRQVFSVPSHTSESISVWEVGTPTVPAGQTLATCITPIPTPDPALRAPASRFGLVLGGMLAVDALFGLAWWQLSRRRRVSSVAA
ncbi:ArnT family glycosyltransferase [Jatrophihabitans sp. YIM 134969]